MVENPESEELCLDHPLPPSSLPKLVKYLKSPWTGAHIYLLGTAHISKESVADVEKCFDVLGCDIETVFLELCRLRKGLLHGRTNTTQAQSSDSSAQSGRFPEHYRSGKSAFAHLLASLMDKAQNKLKIELGGEFITAYKFSKAKNTNLILGDRTADVTISRAWAQLRFFEKIKVIFSLIWGITFQSFTEEEIEKCKNEDVMAKAFEEMSEKFPSLINALVHERDTVLAFNLATAQGRVVFGVVGSGHLKGIEKNFAQFETQSPHAVAKEVISLCFPMRQPPQSRKKGLLGLGVWQWCGFVGAGAAAVCWGGPFLSAHITPPLAALSDYCVDCVEKWFS